MVFTCTCFFLRVWNTPFQLLSKNESKCFLEHIVIAFYCSCLLSLPWETWSRKQLLEPQLSLSLCCFELCQMCSRFHRNHFLIRVELHQFVPNFIWRANSWSNGLLSWEASKLKLGPRDCCVHCSLLACEYSPKNNNIIQNECFSLCWRQKK